MAFIRISNLTKQFNRREKPVVDHFNLEIKQGEIISLLGPSGCGKTTTLRMIAGFETPSSGEIQIGDQLVYSRKGSVPPEKRGIGMVFQDYALFPHLTIEKNVLFGLGKWKARDRQERLSEVLELVGLLDYRERYPHELSGGQQQRVALARALAPNPHVILMDEPFSNLDAGLREQMRYDVTNILRKAKTTAIIVTHDQKDAFAVSDRVVVMKDGVIQQVAPPREMYVCPKNSFVATFVGKTNLISGNMYSDDLKHVFTGIGKVCLAEKRDRAVEECLLSIRPEGCRLVKEGRYSGEVEHVTYSGEYQELLVKLQTSDGLVERLTLYAPIEEEIKKGDLVSFDITPELVALVEN